MSRVLRRAFIILGLVASAACPSPVPVDFAVPSAEPRLGTPFLETPWPSDLMVTSGSIDLGTFPNPSSSAALEDVIGLFQTAPGYSATGTLYFHVDGGVDEASLPASPAASLTADASLFLVETRSLRRIPIEWAHYPDGTAYLPAGTVAVQPLLGALPRGRFALVVTSRAKAAGGEPLGPSPDLRALMTCEALPPGRRAVPCEPYRELAGALELSPDDVALIQLVTPVDATRGLLDAVAVARALPAPPYTVTARRPAAVSGDYSTYDGVVSLAQFQTGAPPWDALDGTSGGFVLDDEGVPQVQRFEEVRFVLTVPRASMPAAGYCVVVNGHGTGGDLESVLGDGAFSEAWQAARAGCAMISTSEPLHRTRQGHRAGQEEILTFNFFNPVAGRDNWRQSALEKVQLVSLAQTLTVPASITGGEDVQLDPASVSYFGHSQGGIVGALVVAVEDRIDGAFLSGAGAGFQASLVEKKDPVEIAAVLRQVLSLSDDETIDRFHPVITLLQTWVDPADPINYGPLWRERSGPVPHLVVSSGLLDTFTPPRCHGALAGSFGLPLASPVGAPVDVLDVLGIERAGEVLEGNLRSADGAPLTAGVLQYPDDGHFAIYENASAQTAVRTFFLELQRGVPAVRVE